MALCPVGQSRIPDPALAEAAAVDAGVLCSSQEYGRYKSHLLWRVACSPSGLPSAFCSASCLPSAYVLPSGIAALCLQPSLMSCWKKRWLKWIVHFGLRCGLCLLMVRAPSSNLVFQLSHMYWATLCPPQVAQSSHYAREPLRLAFVWQHSLWLHTV